MVQCIVDKQDYNTTTTAAAAVTTTNHTGERRGSASRSNQPKYNRRYVMAGDDPTNDRTCRFG